MSIPVTNAILRELLPRSTGSGNVHDSAPLSAADLIAVLENITARSEGIKEKVHKTVTTYNTEFLRIIAQSNETVLKVENVSRGLKNVLELLGEKEAVKVSDGSRSVFSHGTATPTRIDVRKKSVAEYDNDAHVNIRKPVDVEICHLVAEVQRLRSKIKEREEALVVVRTVASLYDLLLATEKKFIPSALVEAARDMVVLKKKLCVQDANKEQTPEDHDHDGVRAFKLLQDAWAVRYSKLLGILEGLFSKAIVLDERGSELAVTSYVCEMMEAHAEGNAVDLSSIFTAMDVLGVLDFRLARLGDAVVRSILGPLLKNSRTVISTLVLGSGAKSTSRNVLKWSLGTQSAEAVPEVLYPKIVQIIKFVHDHIFGNHDGLMAQFGRLVWPRLAEAIVVGYIKKAVPNETSQLKDFEHIADLTRSFEKDLAREGLIANFDEARGDKLSMFASDFEVHFALKMKKRVLAKSRDLLMQSEYSLSKSTGKGFDNEDLVDGLDPSIYFLPDEPCAISLVSRSLLVTVHEALENACLSTPRTAMELYHASRDALLLYRAVIPVKIGAKLDSLQIAALCHNDCLYIAQDLLMFKYQYLKELPPCLKQVFTFVDLVPLFRQMAKEVLDLQIKVVQSEVMLGLDHASGFQHTHGQKQFQLTQQALEEVFAAFSNVSTQLRPVLGCSAYKKVIGDLINMVVRRIINEVVSISDIAVEETIQLQKLLRNVQETLPPFLAPAVVNVSEKCQVEEEPVHKLVPLWCKLESLINLLDMSLVSINQAWESGDLSSWGFSPHEVQKLIRAIFSETPLREECVHGRIVMVIDDCRNTIQRSTLFEFAICIAPPKLSVETGFNWQNALNVATLEELLSILGGG